MNLALCKAFLKIKYRCKEINSQEHVVSGSFYYTINCFVTFSNKLIFKIPVRLFFLKRCGCLHRPLVWFIVIMNCFLVETSFPGATSVTDLFRRCPFACICWIAASKDPISEKNLLFTLKAIRIKSSAIRKGSHTLSSFIFHLNDVRLQLLGWI